MYKSQRGERTTEFRDGIERRQEERWERDI